MGWWCLNPNKHIQGRGGLFKWIAHCFLYNKKWSLHADSDVIKWKKDPRSYLHNLSSCEKKA